MTMKDDNKKILELIQERMAIGEERYGHGIRKNDDTTQWGTKADSWTEMGLEEALDLSIYLSAQLLRILDKENNQAKMIDKLTTAAVHMRKKIQRYEMIHAERIQDKTMPHPHECTCGGAMGCQLMEFEGCLTFKFHEAEICYEDCYICKNPDDFPLL